MMQAGDEISRELMETIPARPIKFNRTQIYADNRRSLFSF